MVAAFSGLSWIRPHPPEEADAYSSIATIDEDLVVAKNAGYTVLGFSSFWREACGSYVHSP